MPHAPCVRPPVGQKTHRSTRDGQGVTPVGRRVRCRGHDAVRLTRLRVQAMLRQQCPDRTDTFFSCSCLVLETVRHPATPPGFMAHSRSWEAHHSYEGPVAVSPSCLRLAGTLV